MSRPSSADVQPASETTTAIARWPVPPNWQWVRANQIARIVGGGTPPSRDEANFCSPGKGIPWITPADLTGYTLPSIEHGRRNLTEQGLANCGAKVVPAGSVLLSSRAPIGYCVIASNPVATSQGFKNLVFTDDISPAFIRSYLKHSKEYLHTLASGTTFPEISGRKAGEIAIPLPPLPEQRRIVARLEALEARSRRAREKLAAVPAQLAQARQSLLAAAFRGDLTADYRKQRTYTNWIKGQLKDFAQIRYGKGMPVSNLHETGYPVFGANGVIGYTDSFHFEQPQVLISCRGAYSGKINWSPPRCFITNNSLSVVPFNPEQIVSHWLYYALCGSDTSRMVTGSAQPQVTIANAEVLEVAVPPVAEQNEIVRRLTAAFAKLDAAATAHAAAVAELDRLDQSLLARAFSGGLVSPENTPSIAPATQPASVQAQLYLLRFIPALLRAAGQPVPLTDLNAVVALRFLPAIVLLPVVERLGGAPARAHFAASAPLAYEDGAFLAVMQRLRQAGAIVAAPGRRGIPSLSLGSKPPPGTPAADADARHLAPLLSRVPVERVEPILRRLQSVEVQEALLTKT